jgi:hypothetical protein
LGLVLKDSGILTILERIIPSRTHLGTIEEDPELMQSLYCAGWLLRKRLVLNEDRQVFSIFLWMIATFGYKQKFLK